MRTVSATYTKDVRVPASNLVGDLTAGYARIDLDAPAHRYFTTASGGRWPWAAPRSAREPSAGPSLPSRPDGVPVSSTVQDLLLARADDDCAEGLDVTPPSSGSRRASESGRDRSPSPRDHPWERSGVRAVVRGPVEFRGS
jgi:hypothetical protein